MEHCPAAVEWQSTTVMLMMRQGCMFLLTQSTVSFTRSFHAWWLLITWYFNYCMGRVGFDSFCCIASDDSVTGGCAHKSCFISPTNCLSSTLNLYPPRLGYSVYMFISLALLSSLSILNYTNIYYLQST